jgi:putative copper resistance protein D
VTGLALLWEAGPKALLYVALLPALGACAARWALLPRLRGTLTPPERGGIERALGRVGLASALVVLAATLVRAWTHTVAAFGFADAQSWEALRVIAFESRWGGSWVLQAGAAAALAVSYFLIPLNSRIGWTLVVVSGAGLSVALPLLGHAAGSIGRMAIHTAHLLGAGLWVGTLAAVWIVGRIESGSPDAARRQRVAPELFRQFSTIALSGAALVLMAGLAASALYVEAPSALWRTGYGRVLLLKIGLVVGIGACGFVNWRRFREPGDRSTLPSTVPLEVALACAVALATSLLTELEH